LVVAARLGDERCAEDIIANGVNGAPIDVNLVESGGDRNTALHEAVLTTQNVEIVRMLAGSSGIDMNPQTGLTGGNAASPLYKAVQDSSLESMVFLLIDLGADVNNFNPAKWDSTVMHSVAYKNRVNVFQAFLDAGVDIDKPRENNVSPLMVAAGRGNLEVIKLLLAAGADVNMLSTEGDGRTALDEITVRSV